MSRDRDRTRPLESSKGLPTGAVVENGYENSVTWRKWSSDWKNYGVLFSIKRTRERQKA